jgi:alanyl-tRNA synthetase
MVACLLCVSQLVGVVVKTFGEAYPELVKHQDKIHSVIADTSACCSSCICSWWVWW